MDICCLHHFPLSNTKEKEGGVCGHRAWALYRMIALLLVWYDVSCRCLNCSLIQTMTCHPPCHQTCKVLPSHQGNYCSVAALLLGAWVDLSAGCCYGLVRVFFDFTL